MHSKYGLFSQRPNLLPHLLAFYPSRSFALGTLSLTRENVKRSLELILDILCQNSLEYDALLLAATLVTA